MSSFLTVSSLELRIMHIIYYFSLHQRKPSGVQLDRPQFHHEEEDGALERGNGTDRTLTAGQMLHILFMLSHFKQSIESFKGQSLSDPTLEFPTQCSHSVIQKCHNCTWFITYVIQ